MIKTVIIEVRVRLNKSHSDYGHDNSKFGNSDLKISRPKVKCTILDV